MVTTFLYLLVIFLELLFFAGFSAITLSFIYSSIKGSPYVPTKNKEIDLILTELKLTKKTVFYELGSGDARVSRRAAMNYGLKAVAIDINPLLTFYAKFLAKIQKIKTIKFVSENIKFVSLKNADIIYLFLMPKLITQLEDKFKRELKKGAIIVSHGFKLVGFEKYLINTLDHKPFPTYYYRLS